MAKKKKQEDVAPGSPAWMATFSDLMNLLFCFFVLLFSMSTVDAAKYEQMVASFRDSFSIFDGGQVSIGEGELISNGVNQLNELDEYYSDMGKASESKEESDPLAEYEKVALEAREEATTKVYENIMKEAEKTEIISSIYVDMDEDYNYTRISISGGILFASGKATIRSEAYELLSKVGDILKRYDDAKISIEGHTDNVPIHNSNYESNMRLSQDRAYSVWSYFVENKKLDPITLETSGRGEYEPIANNKTEEGRAKNRRVEIKIYTSGR